MVSYFEHNKMERGDIICNRMEQGEVCVLVSDAGMPAISDPGELLVAQCVQRNIPVYVVPVQRLLFLHWRFQDFQQEDLRLKVFKYE